MIEIVIIQAGFIAFGVWWHYHKAKQHALTTRKMERECQKLELEIEDMQARKERSNAQGEGSVRLANSLTINDVKILLIEGDKTAFATLNPYVLAEELKDIERETDKHDYRQRLLKAKANEALLDALSNQPFLAQGGLVQLKNLCDAGSQDAKKYVRAVERILQEKREKEK